MQYGHTHCQPITVQYYNYNNYYYIYNDFRFLLYQQIFPKLLQVRKGTVVHDSELFRIDAAELFTGLMSFMSPKKTKVPETHSQDGKQ